MWYSFVCPLLDGTFHCRDGDIGCGPLGPAVGKILPAWIGDVQCGNPCRLASSTKRMPRRERWKIKTLPDQTGRGAQHGTSGRVSHSAKSAYPGFTAKPKVRKRALHTLLIYHWSLNMRWSLQEGI